MSLRAAAQVVLEDLEKVRDNGSAKDESDVVTESIETLKEGLIEQRAREAGPEFYKLVTQILASQLDETRMGDWQRGLFTRLWALRHAVKNGTPE